MDYQLLIIFICLNIINVVFQTVRSLATINCGKWIASVVNCITYGLYTIVVVYMMCDLDLFLKAGIVGVCNFIGVFIVKWIEEKTRKDKLWKIEATLPKTDEVKEVLFKVLENCDIPYNYIDIGKYYILNCYSPTQKTSTVIKQYLDDYNAKYFVSETKCL